MTMEQKTPEQRAEERFQVVAPKPSFSNALTDAHLLALAQEAQRTGYATCYREEVEPCRKMIQELVDAMEGTKRNVSWWREHPSESWIHDALAKAKDQFGIEPSKLK